MVREKQRVFIMRLNKGNTICILTYINSDSVLAVRVL